MYWRLTLSCARAVVESGLVLSRFVLQEDELLFGGRWDTWGQSLPCYGSPLATGRALSPSVPQLHTGITTATVAFHGWMLCR